VERVRTSGGGYGRSIYLHADDGRLFVFGHLDAFDEPLASYADSVQRAIVEYEQDLAPPPGRFRVSAGQRIAWSGESGVGPPHLHLEIRIGDMAMNPLRAGLALPDTRVPESRGCCTPSAATARWRCRRATLRARCASPRATRRATPRRACCGCARPGPARPAPIRPAWGRSSARGSTCAPSPRRSTACGSKCGE